MCPQCAARIMMQIAEHNAGAAINISLCSDACGDALERYTKDRELRSS
jgi:hypothetical protein